MSSHKRYFTQPGTALFGTGEGAMGPGVHVATGVHFIKVKHQFWRLKRFFFWRLKRLFFGVINANIN